MGGVAESSSGSRDRRGTGQAGRGAPGDGYRTPARRLVEGGLVRVRVQGRHRYHELAGPQVAAVLEALAQLAPPAPVRSLREHRGAIALAEARTCYDHLAGRRGVELCDRLLAAGALRAIDERNHALTDRGQQLVAHLSIDADHVAATRRVFARSCIDWTQRRPHLAGALPAAITDRLFTLGWLSRTAGRGLRLAADYDLHLDHWLLPVPDPPVVEIAR